MKAIKRVLVQLAAAMVAAILVTNAAPAASASAARADASGLVSFESDAALSKFLARLIKEAPPPPPVAPPPPPPMPAPPPPSPVASVASVAPSASATSAGPASITNNQIQGVDEGDIVKLNGDTLIVLRRGRLFTFSLAGGNLRSIGSVDAFPPGVNARYDWIDEMLVAGEWVIVIGYSYDRGGTQLTRFRLSADGRLAFNDSYHLRSSDYYSSENYATRLVGNHLYLYAPLDLGYADDSDGNPLSRLPALRRWRTDNEFGPFRRAASARQVFIPRPLLAKERDAQIDTLHSIYDCDISRPELDCSSTVVLGSSARTFFVSQNAVYLWVNDIWRDAGETARRSRATAFLYRVPLDGGRPAAVGVKGAPIDQFSFRPDVERNQLQVFVSASGGGDAMWNPEVTTGRHFALLTVPTSAFGDGTGALPAANYAPLPAPPGTSYSVRNRWVGDHLLYARASHSAAGDVTIVDGSDKSAVRLKLVHSVDRLDAIGPAAVAIGSGPGFLGFTPIELGSSGVTAKDTFRLKDGREGETRSHAFFFRPDPNSEQGSSGLLGLPVALRRQTAGRPFLGDSAAIEFLRTDGASFVPAGRLEASGVAGNSAADGCVASCTDWYGNARPIFAGSRLFALLGYELVEGDEANLITERKRVDFTPRPAPSR